LDRSCDLNLADSRFRTVNVSSQLAPVQESEREDSMQYGSKSFDEGSEKDDDSYLDCLLGRRAKNAETMASISEVQAMDRNDQYLTSTQEESSSSSTNDVKELRMLDNEIEQGPRRNQEWLPHESPNAPFGSHSSIKRSRPSEDKDVGKDGLLGLLRDMETEQNLRPSLEASTSKGLEDGVLSSRANRESLNTDTTLKKMEGLEKDIVQDVVAVMKDIEAKFQNVDDLADNNHLEVLDGKFAI
jgi:hypothetical protein